jgi:hypothetical protein
VFATSLSENSVVKATGSAFTAVRRFTNVAFTAWASVGPSKSNCCERSQMSWKSFIRLFSVPSLTNASDFLRAH